MDREERGRAAQALVDRIEANGTPVISAQAVQKGRDSYVVAVAIEGDDRTRYGVVTRSELS